MSRGSATKHLFMVGMVSAVLVPISAWVSIRPGGLQAQAQAQAQTGADWPCIQRKVPELSAVAVWSGPSIDEAVARWREDSHVAALVEQIAARRTPLDVATAAVAGFAEGLGPEVRAETLTLVFAGLFQTLDRERSEVIVGIERYGRKQKAMADRIRSDMARVSELADGAQAAELQNQLLWQTRIFNERRASLSFVCEVPTLIEQRLFMLARAIANELPS
jgi:hypothetical protein